MVFNNLVNPNSTRWFFHLTWVAIAVFLISCNSGGSSETGTANAPDGTLDLVSAGGKESETELSVDTNGFEILIGAGGGGFEGDGGPSKEAKIYAPISVAVDPEGNVYISGDHRVRKITAATGIINTFAGSGRPGFGGDGGPASEGNLKLPEGIALDSGGNLYIADSANGRIRKVDSKSGMITTVAGGGPPVPNRRVNTGDGGSATEAYFKEPRDVAVDSNGNIYFVAEDRVRRVDAATGIITTYAGTGVRGMEGDDGPANEAKIADAMGLAFDDQDNLYIADTDNQRVRVVNATTGIIRTLAGVGFHGSDETLDVVQPGKRKDPTKGMGYSGDGGPGNQAMLRIPHGVAIGPNQQLYIADMGNDVIRVVDLNTGIISTAADGGAVTGKQYNPDGYQGSGALEVTFTNFSPPRAVFADIKGDLYIVDIKKNQIVRYSR